MVLGDIPLVGGKNASLGELFRVFKPTTLARWACDIEEHDSSHRGCPTPMDIEWAKDG